MSLFVDTKSRSDAVEIMDNFSMEGKLLRDTLDKLGTINKWLGGNKITLNGIHQFLKNQPKNKIYTILDVGCGHGDMLRLIADYGKKNKFNLQLIGIDANADAIAYANELSKAYENLKFKTLDVFSEDFNRLDYDIAILTLFLHHFNESQIAIILNQLSAKATIGIVINDLHRNRLAYVLFSILGKFIANKMIVNDGLISILRGFKRRELEAVSNILGLKSEIRWCWAFRYQWLIFRYLENQDDVK